jgi:hypothetical protein
LKADGAGVDCRALLWLVRCSIIVADKFDIDIDTRSAFALRHAFSGTMATGPYA